MKGRSAKASRSATAAAPPAPPTGDVAVNVTDGGTVIPASMRPDGTWRKPIKVRAGYVPQDEVRPWESSAKRYQREVSEMGLVGWDHTTPQTKKKHPAASPASSATSTTPHKPSASSAVFIIEEPKKKTKKPKPKMDKSPNKTKTVKETNPSNVKKPKKPLGEKDSSAHPQENTSEVQPQPPTQYTTTTKQTNRYHPRTNAAFIFPVVLIVVVAQKETTQGGITPVPINLPLVLPFCAITARRFAPKIYQQRSSRGGGGGGGGGGKGSRSSSRSPSRSASPRRARAASPTTPKRDDRLPRRQHRAHNHKHKHVDGDGDGDGDGEGASSGVVGAVAGSGSVERISLSSWDEPLLRLLHYSTHTLVLCRQPTRDIHITAIAKAILFMVVPSLNLFQICPHLQVLHISNGSELTDKALEAIHRMLTLKKVVLVSDAKFSPEKLSAITVLVFHFQITAKFTETLIRVVDTHALLLDKIVKMVLTSHETLDDKLFTNERTATEALLQNCLVAISEKAVNYTSAVAKISKDFFYMLSDSLGIVSFVILRYLGHLFDSTDTVTLDEWVLHTSSWGRAWCRLSHPRPQEISQPKWQLTRYMNGVFRAMVAHVNDLPITQGFLDALGPLVKAIDLSELPVSDQDLGKIIQSCPDLEILLLSDASHLTSAGLLNVSTLKQLKFFHLSGTLHVSPALMLGLYQRGVTLEYDPLSKQLSDSVSESAKNIASGFSKEVSEVISGQKLRQCRPGCEGLTFANAVENHFVSKAKSFMNSLRADEELATSATKLFLRRSSFIMSTPAMWALVQVESEKERQGLFHHIPTERIWIAHYAFIQHSTLPKTAKSEEKSSSSQTTASSVSSAITAVVAPLVKGSSGNEVHHAIPTVEALEQALVHLPVKMPGMPPYSVVTMQHYFKQFFSDLVGLRTTKKLTRAEDECVKLWSICGSSILQQAMEAFSAGFGVSFGAQPEHKHQKPSKSPNKEKFSPRALTPVLTSTASGIPSSVPSPSLLSRSSTAPTLSAIFTNSRDSKELQFLKQKDNELTEELARLLLTCNSSGEQLHFNEVVAVLQRLCTIPGTIQHIPGHSVPNISTQDHIGALLSIADVTALCSRLCAAHKSLADFFGSPQVAIKGVDSSGLTADITDEAVLGMWQLYVIGELVDTFAPYHVRPDRNPLILGQVLLCSLLCSDLLPVVVCDKLGLLALLSTSQYSLLWNSLCNTMSPHYNIFYKESALNIINHWRSYNYTKIKQERPKGVPGRQYLFDCVFSYTLRKICQEHPSSPSPHTKAIPTAGTGTDSRKHTHNNQTLSPPVLLSYLSKWELQLWKNGRNFVESIDLSDFEPAQVHDIGHILKLLLREQCPVVAVNLQNTHVTWNELRFLTPTCKYLNLDDCNICDDDVAVICAHCPILEQVFIRNCPRLTDASMMQILHLKSQEQQLMQIPLKLLDISGNLLIKEPMRAMVNRCGVYLRAELFTAQLNKKIWSHSKKTADQFIASFNTKISEWVPGTESEGDDPSVDPVEGLIRNIAMSQYLTLQITHFVPNEVRASLEKLLVPEHFWDRTYRRAFKSVLYCLTPLAALVVERMEWLGLTLSSEEVDEVWMKVFNTYEEQIGKVHAAEGGRESSGSSSPRKTTSPSFPKTTVLATKDNNKSWKQHCLEYYLHNTVFGNTQHQTWESLTITEKLGWLLGRTYVHVLDFTGAVNPLLLKTVLTQVKTLSLFIDALHVPSETAAKCDYWYIPTVWEVVIHGGVLPQDIQNDFARSLCNTHTKLTYRGLHQTLTNPAAQLSTVSASSKPPPQPDTQLDMAADWLASELDNALRPLMFDSRIHELDNLLKAMFSWRKKAEEYFTTQLRLSLNEHIVELHQFLYRCFSRLNPVQLVLAMYSGQTLTLAPNQLDELWKSVANRVGIKLPTTLFPQLSSATSDTATTAAPTPGSSTVSVHEWVVSEYISKQVTDVGVDGEVLLLMRYCDRLHHINLTGATTSFKVRSHVTEFAVLDGGITCEMAVACISHPESLRSFKIRDCEDATNADVKLICTKLTSLTELEVTGSRYITMDCMEDLASLSGLTELTVWVTPDISYSQNGGVPNLDQLCKKCKPLRQLRHRIGREHLHITITDWNSLPSPNNNN
ncbi:hypothetical protein Pelo_6231 [Pelomyxa schiedti]|nr:hypothetical protein Pelo_6231 [Pelomyxa schiedti]